MQIKKENIQPVGKRCLIETYKESSVTSSGFYRAEKEYEATPVVGTVFRAGTESSYKVGDIVMFRRYSLDELKFTDDTEEVSLNLVEDDEIVCLVTQDSIV